MTEPIKGFDVSHHQNPDRVPWAELKRQGYTWCYIRAAYGAKPDRHFAEHVAQAEWHGIEWGAYLYLRDTRAPPSVEARRGVDQASEFADLVHDYSPNLLPCLDIEESEPSEGYLAGARPAATYLRDASGGCVIYTGAVYRVVHRLSSWTGMYPEWIADYDGPIYGYEDGVLPEAHQHSGKGRVGGYGPLDLNVAHDLDAFRIEPRKAEAVGDRVPELVDEVRHFLDAIGTDSAVDRTFRIDGLGMAVERLAEIIEQDAEAARGKGQQ